MRDREDIMGEMQGKINSETMTSDLYPILEVLLDIRDALHAVRETGGKK